MYPLVLPNFEGLQGGDPYSDTVAKTRSRTNAKTHNQTDHEKTPANQLKRAKLGFEGLPEKTVHDTDWQHEYGSFCHGSLTY